ncbi:hypothetical protein CYLTODRAFT_444353 [Cylindrobasidium torrendii FP15055 ss-10]|uniref:Uncharacterized protein n=1 Tax=Cylindrobasidium torrendii FP15055 ss-10 TaxID=1314674 RepID=A0A0D7B8Z6_9AGAR|nr:hypothetical protein CYLTODRAFT_444353 [Cylindrobasidium torrendii FP15055 ss-10]
MLPSPAPSTCGLQVAQADAPNAIKPPGPLLPKGHLEPHVSNLPRRRRYTQLPTPDSDTSDDVPEPMIQVSKHHRPATNHAPQSTTTHPYARPVHGLGVFRSAHHNERPAEHAHHHESRHHHHHHHHTHPDEEYETSHTRRARLIEVIPGSGVFAAPQQGSLDEDDSGIPPADFHGAARAAVLGRALLYLCMKEPWRSGLVEGVYFKLHDLEMIPEPWTGALRREGLAVVDTELRRRQGEGQQLQSVSAEV